MRLEELVLRTPGDEFRVRFHEQLTVLSGIGMLERQALADSLLGALTGNAENTMLTYVDRAGRPVEILSAGGTAACRYLDDGSPALPLVGTIAPTADALRGLVLLQAGDLGLTPTRERADEHPELAEARATLNALTDELQATLANRQQHERLRDELSRVRSQIRQAEDGTARREYAQILAELERVRAEAAALQSGSSGAETDRHLLESVGEARVLAARWTEATEALAALSSRFVAERLDPTTVGAARWFPEVAPTELSMLLEDLNAARKNRTRLDARLRDLATSRLPEPSDPLVVTLATTDQDELWRTCRTVHESGEGLQRERVAMGGAGADDGVNDVIDRIESTHSVVEDVEALVDRRRVPVVASAAVGAVASILIGPLVPIASVVLLAGAVAGVIAGLGRPMRQLSAARRDEAVALGAVGAPTYLAFHIRRVEASMMPGAHGRLEASTEAYRVARARWDELAHGVSVEQALRLEDEVRAYARELAKLGSSASEVDKLRQELTERAEPAVMQARASLVEACATYGLDDVTIETADPRTIEQLIAQQVALGEQAREQEELEDAEAVEQKLANRIDDLLHQLGFRDGTLDARVGALEWAVDRATEREAARTRARSRQQIEDDLVQLQNEARRLRRPEWASVQPSEADGPDLDELVSRKAELDRTLDGVKLGDDLERLADRHSAMERRVAALEAQHDPTHEQTTISQLADVQQYLLAHLTKAAHAGPSDESVPVLLDEPFLRIAAERKWELLDMLRRLGEKTQLVYLTDDPFVGAWARRRASAGLIRLLEPVEA
ncbi:MAG TPA: hypothetical protein VGJ03_04750 [Acidimicrobiales bacterium]|jgi:hypothetical protein